MDAARYPAHDSGIRGNDGLRFCLRGNDVLGAR